MPARRGMGSKSASSAHLMASAVGEAVFACDLDGVITLWNQGARSLWGLGPQEALGAVLPHIPSDRRRHFLAVARRVAAAAEVCECSEMTQRRDAGPLRCALTVVPGDRVEGEVGEVLAIVCDAGSAWRAEELLASVTESLSERIRIPITAVIGYAQLLSRPELIEDRAKRTRVVEGIEARGKELADLVEDLAVLERLVLGTGTPSPEPTDIAGLVAGAVMAAEAAVPARRFVVEYDPRVGSAMIDPKLVRRALDKSLARCALDSPAGAEVHVTVTEDAGEAIVRIRVAGPGPGRGAAAEEGALPEEGAANLGQAVLAAVLRAHGGSMEVERASDKERSTVIRIPLGMEGDG